MSLTPEDLDNIQMRTKLHSLEMKDDIVKAMQESFDKHLETNHVPMQEDMKIVEGDVKLAHDRISAVKRIMIYVTGFGAGMLFLIGLAYKFG